jgi:ATP-dependent DNA ligase
MEALERDRLPDGPGWQYEPKWDGFRCLAFRDGKTVRLQSKALRPLERYFPEVAAALRAVPATRFVLDGELVVPVRGRLSFDDLLQRIHPAASRVATLAASRPATFVAFDLLAEGADVLAGLPLAERRTRLEAFARRALARVPRVVLSPATRSRARALRWLEARGSALDGVIAKRADERYRSGERAGMVKVKRRRTADCVVGGFRRSEDGSRLGSLLLGLHDRDGRLHHVGFTSSLSATARVDVERRVAALRGGTGFTGRAPGGPSRWNERGGAWEPVHPRMVVEVEYDHVSGGRFRHGTRFLRRRPDKDPRSCTMEQITTRGRGPSLPKAPAARARRRRSPA